MVRDIVFLILKWLLALVAILTAGILFAQGNLLVGSLAILASAVFLVYRVVRIVQWRRQARPPRLRWFFSWFLPLLLLTTALPWGMWVQLQKQPVPYRELVTVTGRLESLRQSKFTHVSKSSVSYEYHYSILLQSQGRFFLPSGPAAEKMQDIRSFLTWAGEDTLTLLCDGNRRVYQLSREDGDQLVTYEQSAEKIWRAVWVQIATWLCFILLLAGTLTLLPKWLMEGPTFRERAVPWGIFLMLMGLFTLLVLTSIRNPKRPEVTDLPAYTSVRLSIGQGADITLPPEGWRVVDPEDDYLWVQRERSFVSHFMLWEYDRQAAWTGTRAEWERTAMEESRKILLDTFLTSVRPDWDPGRILVWTGADGRSQVYSEIVGAAQDTSRNHFYLIPLYDRRAVALFQSSACREVDWEELHDYAQQHILPLIDTLEVQLPD